VELSFEKRLHIFTCRCDVKWNCVVTACYIPAEGRFGTIDIVALHAVYREWEAEISLKESAIETGSVKNEAYREEEDKVASRKENRIKLHIEKANTKLRMEVKFLEPYRTFKLQS
jgi:hypothetical protein